MMTALQQFDTALFLKVHRDFSNAFFDGLMPLMRNRFFWTPLYLFIIVYCLKQYKKLGYYIIGMLLFTFAMGDLIASRLLKPLVMRPRPCNEISLTDEIIHRVPCGSGYSFPSAHATNHFAIALFLICLFYPKWKGILPLALGWATIISFAQVYVGVHYPIDVTVGAILGTCIGLFTFYLYQRIKPQV